MSKSNDTEYYVLAGLLTGVAFPQIWDNASSSALTATWVSLHDADPTDAGYQGSNELSTATYVGYTRIAVTRSTAGWVCSTSGGNASPVSAITFGQITSTSTGTASYFGVGFTSDSTAGQLILSGSLSPTIDLGQNVTPRLTTGSSLTED